METRWMMGGLLTGMLVAGAAVGASDVDLGWISGIPGLSVFSQKGTAAYSKTLYTVSGSGEAAMESVRRGLRDRGWAIETSKTASLPALSATRLVAAKDGSRVKIGLTDLGGVNLLVVEQAPRYDAAATVGPEPATPTGRGPAPRPAPGRGAGRRDVTYDCDEGGDVTINNGGAAVTVTGHCENVTVNGDGNEIAVEADSDDLTVNGASNQVRVEGAVRRITTNGSSNSVTWSTARNPRGPRIRDNGTGNTTRRH